MKRSLVRDGYDAIAEHYYRQAANGLPSHPRRQATSALLAGLQPGSSVLELGCGSGVPVAAEIVGRGHGYVGIDISPRQIELARRFVPNGDFRCGDIVEQSFEAEIFDAVVAFYVITHVPRERWRGLFAHVSQWLRPGGVLVLNVPHGDSPGWLEEDFLGFGATNWTNAYGAETTVGILEAHHLSVLEAKPLPEDDDSSEEWVWITAQRATSA